MARSPAVLIIGLFFIFSIVLLVNIFKGSGGNNPVNDNALKLSTLHELLLKSGQQDHEFPHQALDGINEREEGRNNSTGKVPKEEREEVHNNSPGETSKEEPILLPKIIDIDKEEKEKEPVEQQFTGKLQELYDGSFGPRFENYKALEQYEDLVFCTIVPDFNSSTFMNLLRAFVGGIHQLREGRHRTPRIILFTPIFISEIPSDVMEETSWWSAVQLYNIHNYLGLPISKVTILKNDDHQIRLALLDRLVKEHGHAIWIKFGYVVEPVRIPIYRAENAGNVQGLLDAYQSGRNVLITMVSTLKKDGYIQVTQTDPLIFSNKLDMTGRKKAEEQALVAGLYKPGEIVLEGYTVEKGLEHIRAQLGCLLRKEKCSTSEKLPETFDASKFGIYPSDPSSQAACLVDIREEGIFNTLFVNEVVTTPLPSAYKENLAGIEKNRIRKVAIAFPTTSKGLKEGEEPIFLSVLIPSFIKSVTLHEYHTTIFTIYIGYDHGDALFDDEGMRNKIMGRLVELTGDYPIQVKMLQLPNARRVALLWNLLYLHALREGAEYFYQVNDDLNMVTSGWLTYFTETLDKADGFGVVGPADYHNELHCAILTQSMVTPVHFEIFGMLYPVELKDWKSDRWLTYVYQPNDMHCRPDVIANNGAAPTRYAHCEFLSYIIYLEAGKRRIAEWKASKEKVTQTSLDQPTPFIITKESE
jgi:hypothetical protein